jgi:CubicO group peptidase (beta-lactamase class C family)
MSSAFVCLVAALSPNLFPVDRIDRVVRDEMKAEHINGVSLVVLQHGKVIKNRGYGYSNLELKTKATADTEWQTGSDGKMYTATAALLLMQQGRLQPDEPMSQHLKIPDAWKDIKLRDLLNHTAGLPDYVTQRGFDPTKDYTLDTCLDLVRLLPLDFQPDTSWGYSNTNYIAVGRIVELMAGLNYDKAIKELVFKAAGLQHSSVNNPSYLIANRANGYLQDADGGPLNVTNWSQTLMQFPDGALVQTAGDLAKFADALGDGKVIDKQHLDLMWTPAKLQNGRQRGYGMGWSVPIYPGHQVYEHAGNMEGFNSEVWKDVTSGVTIAVCTNQDGRGATLIAHRIAREVLRQTRPTKGTAPSPTDDEQKLIRTCIDGVLHGKLDESLLTSDFAIGIKSPRGQAFLANGSSLGALQKLEYLDSAAGLGEVVHTYRLTTDKGVYRIDLNIFKERVGTIAWERLPER